MKILFVCIAIILVFVLCFFFPIIPCIIGHIVSIIVDGIIDIFYYFYHKKYNIPEYGFVESYCGLFGKGKTLNATTRILKDYQKYNGKLVYITSDDYENYQKFSQDVV